MKRVQRLVAIHADLAASWLAWRLPRLLVQWAYIRVVAGATTGRYGDTVPGELDVMTALRRWQSEA